MMIFIVGAAFNFLFGCYRITVSSGTQFHYPLLFYILFWQIQVYFDVLVIYC